MRAVVLALLALTLMASASPFGWILIVEDCARAVAVGVNGSYLVATCMDLNSTMILELSCSGKLVNATEVRYLVPRLATAVNGSILVVGSINGTAAVANVTSGRATVFENLTELVAIDSNGRFVAGSSVVIDLRSFRAFNVGNMVIYAVESLGDLLVIGGSLDGDAVVVAINASDGSVLWSSRFYTPYPDWISGIAIDSVGRIYVVGVFDYPPNIFVAAINASDGSVLWIGSWGTDGSDIATGIALVSGMVVVVGYTNGFGSYSMLVLFIDAYGGRLEKVLKLSSTSFDIATPRIVRFVAGTDRLVVPGVAWSGAMERALIAYLPTQHTVFDTAIKLETADLEAVAPPSMGSANVNASVSTVAPSYVELKLEKHETSSRIYTPRTTTSPIPVPVPPIDVAKLITMLVAIATLVAVTSVTKRVRTGRSGYVKRT